MQEGVSTAYLTADHTKSLGSPSAAETTRYFLLNLDLAQVALGWVVVKWNARIFHETEHLITFFAQTTPQVVFGALFDPAPFPGGSELFGMRFEACADSLVSALLESLSNGGIEGFIAFFPGLFGSMLRSDQDGIQGCRRVPKSREGGFLCNLAGHRRRRRSPRRRASD